MKAAEHKGGVDWGRWGWIGLTCAVSLIILGLRWQVVRLYTADLPDWDQWDAEGVHVLAQWYGKTDFLGGLWLPQNEHRSVLTKLVNWVVVLANGQWDQRLQAALNVILPITMAVMFMRWLRNNSYHRIWPLAGLVFCAIWALPVAWHNVVAAFHSAQFYLLICGWLTLSILPFEHAGTRRWWGGIVAACLGLLSMASGFVAASCVIIVVLLRVWIKRTPLRPFLPTLLICAILTVVGAKIGVHVPGHEALKAHSFHDVWVTLGYSLRWPTHSFFWIPLIWLPVAAVFCSWWTRTEDSEGIEGAGTLIGAGGWVLAQFLAAAVFRGAGGVEPASRYMDTVAMGTGVNALALAWWVTHCRPKHRVIVTLSGVTWLATTLIGAIAQGRESYDIHLPNLLPYRAECTLTTRDYISTGKREALLQGRVPYPGVDAFRLRIDSPLLQNIMPASVRRPIDLESETLSGPFVRSDARAQHDARTGAILTDRNSLPRDFPKLGMERIWGSGQATDKGTWQSLPVTPSGNFLRFEVAGTWDDPGVALELRDAKTGDTVARIVPVKSHTLAWQPAYVPSPQKPFIVFARDESAQGWIAFSRPRAEALGSSIARRALREGKFLAQLGAALFVISAALVFWRSESSLTEQS